MTVPRKTYFKGGFAEKDSAMRQRLRDLMSSMETNTDEIEDVISRFEDKLDDITKRLNNLEDRVTRLEKKMDPLR
ncbi:MAG: DUF4349 domain-containing protein [Candidatus Methanomethyliaceae archaeon]|nr:DUF4349 domain-containing protein [Candidatus Methanomethyliaceae archaeon]